MKRLFFAIDLSEDVVEGLGRLQEEFDAHLGNAVRVRWTPAENLHLTLKFLGATEKDLIESVAAEMDEIAADAAPFEMTVRGIGAFPHPGHPRILWAGVDESSAAELTEMHGALEDRLAGRFEVDRDDHDFQAHVTFGRVKSSRAPDLPGLRSDLPEGPFGEVAVDEVVLYESELDDSGASYRVLHRSKLGD